jgi:hypothetical protein
LNNSDELYALFNWLNFDSKLDLLIWLVIDFIISLLIRLGLEAKPISSVPKARVKRRTQAIGVTNALINKQINLIAIILYCFYKLKLFIKEGELYRKGSKVFLL